MLGPRVTRPSYRASWVWTIRVFQCPCMLRAVAAAEDVDNQRLSLDSGFLIASNAQL